jgi:hypothetical protein
MVQVQHPKSEIQIILNADIMLKQLQIGSFRFSDPKMDHPVNSTYYKIEGKK